ncbi:UNVERIFIED_CONTAM: hypothetical protein FKN15_040269 [Acipenser sinensis]
MKMKAQPDGAGKVPWGLPWEARGPDLYSGYLGRNNQPQGQSCDGWKTGSQCATARCPQKGLALVVDEPQETVNQLASPDSDPPTCQLSNATATS